MLEHRYLDELSGGQRQRAYVAMVLAQDTDVMLLDEPLNNLDMKHAVAMMAQLRRAADELGRTIVIVLHDINFAGHYADRICAMKDGKVVELGHSSRDHDRRGAHAGVRDARAGDRRPARPARRVLLSGVPLREALVYDGCSSPVNAEIETAAPLAGLRRRT